MRSIMGELLAAQYPVLTWWGLLTVLTRAAATITVVCILSVGATLVARGQLTAGDVVAFIWLRQCDDRQARHAVGLRRAHLPVGANAAHLLRPARRHRGGARAAGRHCAGACDRRGALRGRDVPLQEQRPGCVRHRLRRADGNHDGAGWPHRRRQDHDASAAAAPALARRRAHPGRRPGHRGRDAQLAAPPDRRGVPGRGALQPLDCREHPRRPAGGERRGGRGSRAPRRGARFHPQEARRLPVRDRRARAPRCRAASASASPSPAPS